MPTLTVCPLEELRELAPATIREQLHELLINGGSPYRTFCLQVERAGTHVKELRVIQSLLLCLAQGQPLPSGKFKPLTRDKKDGVPDYEFKTKNLRLYLFKHPVSGKVVVGGGAANKTQQPQDIARMRNAKKQFYTP